MISAGPGARRTRSPLRQTRTCGTPARRASSACSARCSASPCAGMRIFGRTQPIMSRNSSRRGMAGDVNEMGAVGDDLDALRHQAIDHPRQRPSRCRGSARDEKITRSPLRERDFRMLVLGDARQRGARLALAAGAERQNLVGRQVAVALHAAKLLHAVEIAGLARHLRRRAPWRGRPGRPRGRRRARRRPPRAGGRHGRQTSSRRRGAARCG